MKKLFALTIVLVMCLGLYAKDYNYKTVAGDKLQARIYTLDNGLTVYLSVNKEKPRIQTYIAVKTGSRNDPAETTGLAHYLEHLMFKGTKQFGTSNPEAEAPLLQQIEDKYEYYRTLTDPEQRRQCYHEIDSISQIAAQYNIPNEYDKLMASIGSEGSNAYTSNDITCYVENIPANEVEKWAKVQGDRFQNMVIRGFHTELEAVYEEYNIGLGSDGEKEFEALTKLLFPNHPYGTQSTIGTQEHLKNPSIVNIKNYFNRYYCPNNVAICMAGDLDPEKTIAIIDKYFGNWKPNKNLSQPQYAPVKDLTAPRDTAVVGKEAENIIMAWKFDASASMQADTLSVIEKILSNGKAGLFDLDLDQKMAWLGGGAFFEGLAEYSLMGIEAMPKEGQSLDDLKKLVLTEIDKLKKGDFSEDLIVAIKNNMKLDESRALDSNQNRANQFVDAFINGKKWDDVVNRLNRINNITKDDVVAFANRHFGDNYVVVYKRMGEDKNQKKIDKPAITPIPSNRDMQSQFVTDIINENVDPIQPKFVDFDKDLTKTTTKKGLPVLYVKNTSDDRFSLVYYYKFGEKADKWYDFADYLDYLGTNKLSAEELKMQFYKLACSYRIQVSADAISVSLSGLKENMVPAMKLMEDFFANAKVDTEAWNNYIDLSEKAKNDAKLNQRSNFSALRSYAFYGGSRENNPQLHQATIAEMKQKNPQEIIDLFKNLSQYKHTLLYYGSCDTKEICQIVDKNHKTAKNLKAEPAFTDYKTEQTTQNEVYVAPYDAKNIYMIQYNNEGRQWSLDREPVITTFNEYFGGGMNTVVFQELRETRGLAYSASARYAEPGKKGDPEYGMTYIISQNDKMVDCINTFNSILNEMPQSEAALELAKQSVEKSIASNRTMKFSIINAYLAAQRLGLDVDENKYVYDHLSEVNMQNVADFEKQVMANKPYRYIILGNEADLDMDFLKTLGPVKKLSTEEIFGY